MISSIPASVMNSVYDNMLAPLAIMGTMILILCLIVAELSASHDTITTQKLTENINVIILPLIFTFGIIVMINIIMVIL